MTRHRVVVLPWLRLIGPALIPNWLAITIGSSIFAWRKLTDAELEHELEHVRQWKRHGLVFPIVYFAESLRVRRSGRRWYNDNKFEEEARKAASTIQRR